jgi:hypothetical protein
MAKKRRKSVTCPNCQYQFDGIDNYCPNCGQENHSHHAPFRHIFVELIESLTHFDTKFFATVKALFLKPGLLTKDYIEDKRARYVPPVRLYIFVSFIFFFLLSLLSSSDNEKISFDNSNPQPGRANIGIHGHEEERDSIVSILKKEKSVTSAMIDSMITAKFPDESWPIKLLLKQSIRANLGIITMKDLGHAYIKHIGILVFVLMPIFALFLKILYIRGKRLYIEHLIFSVHFHAFIFAVFILTLLLYSAMDESEWSLLPCFVIPVYGLLALHRVYENTWFKTTVKAILLSIAYTTCISVMALFTFFISFALI